MGSIEDGLNRIVEAITPRGLGSHGPRKVKVNEKNRAICDFRKTVVFKKSISFPKHTPCEKKLN